VRRASWGVWVLVLVGLAVVVLLSIGAGFLGAESQVLRIETERGGRATVVQEAEHGGFSWEVFALVLTGLGTTGLALATGALAFSTRTEVRATQQLATLTQQDQANRERPVVLIESAGYVYNAAHGTAEPYGQINVRLVNVGLGPALRVQVQATLREDPAVVGHPTSPVLASIPSGERIYSISFEVRLPESPDRDERLVGLAWRDFDISGTYLDRSRMNTYYVITKWAGG
jgi:hypothetical protein